MVFISQDLDMLIGEGNNLGLLIVLICQRAFKFWELMLGLFLASSFHTNI